MALDLTGGVPNGYLTYAQAVAQNCNGADAGGNWPGGGGVAWGDAGQATFYYDLASGRYEETVLTQGYTGTLTWKSADNMHTYVAQIGKQIQKDGLPFTIDWNFQSPDAGTTQAQLDAELTELYNGLVATFGTGIPQSTNCRLDTTCLEFPDDGTPQHRAVFGARPILSYFVFQNVTSPQPTPSIPVSFYYFAKPTWNDFTTSSLWTTFDTTKVNAASKGFQGIETDGRYLYLTPNANGALVTRYDSTLPSSFTDQTTAWSTFDTTTINPNAKNFSGGTNDGQYVYFAPSKNGVVAQYNSTAAFPLASSWSTFDTTALAPPASQFAGAVFNSFFGPVLFVPAANGVVAAYSSYTGAFTDPTQWSTFDLTTINPGLTQLRGGAAFRQYIYLAPHGAGPTFPGIAARWDSSQPLNSGWQTMDLSLVDPSLATLLAYDGVVIDSKRYVYYVPAANGTSFGGDVLRYDSTLPFTMASSWQFFHITPSNFTGGAWDGRYLYLSGSNSTVTRFDSTGTFTSALSWSSFDVSTINPNAIAFFGSLFDGRYMYFVPDTFSTLARFDARFPPTGLNPFYASSY
jgi:hypothetical protein